MNRGHIDVNGAAVRGVQDHPYLNSDGEQVIKRRFDYVDGSKSFKWPPGTQMADILPFGTEDLKRLQPGEPIIITEGERCVDAVARHGFIALCMPGGSGQKKFDRLTQVLEPYTEHPIFLFPDNDKPGISHMEAMLAHLKAHHHEVRWVPPVVETPGGDIADLLAPYREDHQKARELVLAAVEGALEGPPEPTPAEVPEETRIRLVSLREGLTVPEPPTQWVVDGLLNQGGTSCLSGPFKGGKSTLLRIMCVAAAAGLDFLARSTQPIRVGYISLEEERAGVKDHFRLLSEQVADESCLDRIFYLVGDDWLPAKLDEKIDMVHEVIERLDLGLLILGPLQDFFAFRNINDYSEVKPALRAFTNKVARTTGCHICFDHHNNKYGSGRAAFLGSVAIGGGVDQLLTLTVVEDEKGQVNGRGLTTWQRYGESMLSLLGLDFVPNRIETSLGPPPERLKDQAGLQQLAIRLTAVCHGWTDTRTLEQEIGGNREKRLEALTWAVDQGMLARRPRKGRGGGYEYIDARLFDESDDPGTSSSTSSDPE